MTKVTNSKRLLKKQSKQGEGIAVYKLIGYFKTSQDADNFIKKKAKAFSSDKYQIYRKELVMLWGVEYDF